MWKRSKNAPHEGSSREVTHRAADAVDRFSAPAPSSLWSRGFGELATRSLQLIIVLVLAIAILWGMRSLSLVIIPILLALIFASTFWPVTRWLRGKNVPGALGATIVLLGIVVILSGVAWLITWTVREQWDELSENALDGFEQLLKWVNTLPFAPDQSQIDDWQQQLIEFATSANFGSGALAGVGIVANFFTGLVLMVVVLFFFLKDGPKIWRFLLRPFHGLGLARAERVGTRTVETLGSYVRGTASVALVDSLGIGLGLLILQVPLALPLAVVVFLLSFIPLVGATVAGILGALVALVANGPLSAVLVVGVVVLVNQLEGNFLQPVLMGRALKLHALVILLSLTIGTVVAGILGAILAVPIAAVLWGAIKVWDGPDLPAKMFRPKASETSQ